MWSIEHSVQIGKDMVRFYYVVVMAIPAMIVYMFLMTHYAKHTEKYSEEQCYELVKKVSRLVKKKGRITTKVYGVENLPTDKGYVMYSNHQGRYDALGIFDAHELPCSVVMEKERSLDFICKQFIDVIKGKRLDKTDIRQQIQIMNEIAEEVKEGRKYLIFPEGGYDSNHNSMNEFHAGSFKCAMKAKCDIVPIVIWDSYKAFEGRSLRRVVTQVHFLKPVTPDEYKGMNTAQVCGLVKARMEEKMKSIVAEAGEKRNMAA